MIASVETNESTLSQQEKLHVPMCQQIHITLKGYCGEGDNEETVVANVTLDAALLRKIFQARKLIQKEGAFKKIGVGYLKTNWFADIEEKDFHATTADLAMVYEKRVYLHSLSKHGDERYTSEGVDLDVLWDLVTDLGDRYIGPEYDALVGDDE
jgi:hypothetical protein